MLLDEPHRRAPRQRWVFKRDKEVWVLMLIALAAIDAALRNVYTIGLIDYVLGYML